MPIYLTPPTSSLRRHWCCLLSQHGEAAPPHESHEPACPTAADAPGRQTGFVSATCKLAAAPGIGATGWPAAPRAMVCTRRLTGGGKGLRRPCGIPPGQGSGNEDRPGACGLTGRGRGAGGFRPHAVGAPQPSGRSAPARPACRACSESGRGGLPRLRPPSLSASRLGQPSRDAESVCVRALDRGAEGRHLA